MDRKFDPDKFIRRLGERLVNEFSNAQTGTTSSAVGSAAEQPVRDQLEQLLPRGVAVGEGFVIDCYGGTSRQQDVILYERDICPVFSVNDTPQASYYPCEGVIAVGEVKSSLDRDSLRDAFAKIASVKELRRGEVHEFMPHPNTGQPIPKTRHYLTPREEQNIVLKESITAEERERLHIFGFVLAGKSSLKPDTLVNYFRRFATETRIILSPNLLLTLDEYAIHWCSIGKEKQKIVSRSDDGLYGLSVHPTGPERWLPSLSSESATHVIGAEAPEAFRTLVQEPVQ